MADQTYDKRADRERSPASDNSISGNQTSPGNVGYSGDNAYDHSLRNREENTGEENPNHISHNRAGKTDAAGASSNTSDAKQAASPNELQNAESAPGDNFSYTPGEKGARGTRNSKNNKSTVGGRLKKKAALVAVGIIGTAIGAVVIGFFFFIPLKIEHLVADLEKHFFASSENAVQNETDNLLKGYLRDHLLPAFKSCHVTSTSVVDKTCNIHLGSSSNSPVVNLYKGWRDANLESKLATTYGIEFKYNKSALGGRGEWYLKAPGTNSTGDPLGANLSNFDAEFQRSDRAGMRAAIDSAVQDATWWKKVMYRYKVGRLLEEKYAVKRCTVFCGKRDALAAKPNEAKYAAKLFLIERVIGPHSAALSSVLGCIVLANNGCDGKTSTTTCTQSTCDELAGKAETQVEANVATEVGKASAGFGSETADKLIGLIADIRTSNGASNYVVNKVINKFVGQEGPQNAADEVPVVGELQMVNQSLGFINTLGHANNKLRVYTFLANSGAAVSLFAMYQTYADEVHTGHVTPTEVGSFTQALGSGNQCDASIEKTCDPHPPGGTAQAESTPLYSSLVDGNPSSGHSSTYLCADNKPVPSGKTICPEENLSASSQTLSSITDVMKQTGLYALANAYESSPIAAAFHLVSDATSFLASGISSAVLFAINTLGGGAVIQQAQSFIGSMFGFVVNQIIPSPISADMSGGRTFDMMAAGADVSGNDFAHTGLGGQKISSTLAANIVKQQNDEAMQQFRSQPLFARLFSTDSPYSLLSKVAMDVPFGLSSSLQGSLANILNPLGTLSRSFGSLITGTSSAATTINDPFGVTQYGYPSGTLPSNPEAYWKAHCSDNAAQAYQNDATYQSTGGGQGWNGETSTNPDNGQTVNTTTNPCLLIKSTVCSAGATSDSSLCTSDDLADANPGSGSTGTTPTTAGGFTNPFPGGWTPSRLDMGYDGTFKNQIVSPCDGKMLYSYPDTGHDSNGGWEGSYFVVQCSATISGLPSNAFYFAEGVSPTVQQGQSVTAGQQIGVPGWTGYSEGPGGIEWGLANPANPRETWAAHLGDSCASGSPSQTFVLSFAKWVKQNLNVAAPSSTDNAGCA